MSQHARDRFGNEASRGQDAVPIDQAVEQSGGEGEAPKPENLTDLRALGAQYDAGSTDHAGEDMREGAANAMVTHERNPETNAEMSARVRRAAQAAQRRDRREQQAHQRAPMDCGDALHTLRDQGFSEEEALGLLAVTGRLEESAETREAETTLERLRFTRWLVAQGKLDEWSD